MNFMSIREWGRDGEWSTNFSAIAMSVTTGRTGGSTPATIRSTSPENVPGAKFVPGNENFQMGAFMKGNDGYLYSFGTPSGRGGPAFLSRVQPNLVPDLTKYQYWHGDGEGHWVAADPGAATPIFPGPVGRNVRAIQQLSQAIPGAVHQRRRTTWWQGPHRLRKGLGAQSNCSFRHSRCPVGSTLR